jgi:hypothetical protein
MSAVKDSLGFTVTTSPITVLVHQAPTTVFTYPTASSSLVAPGNETLQGSITVYVPDTSKPISVQSLSFVEGAISYPGTINQSGAFGAA